VRIKKPGQLHGYNWILDKNYGRAYFKGYYEPKLTSYILDNLSHDGCFIDIGSHAGYFSLLASSVAKDGRVLSFEPEPNNYAFIQKIAKLNNISNWTFINAAVGNENGELRFRKGMTSSTGFVDVHGDIVVKQITLDSFLKDLEIFRIDLIKIDVEGFAANVLRGGIESLLLCKPEILLECHANSNEFEVAWELLNDKFDFYDFLNGQLISNFTYEQIDFVLIKPKK
jgi:FkbM family methyltransferase